MEINTFDQSKKNNRQNSNIPNEKVKNEPTKKGIIVLPESHIKALTAYINLLQLENYSTATYTYLSKLVYYFPALLPK